MLTLCFDDALSGSCGSGALGCHGLTELVGRQAPAGPDVKVLWRSDGALVAVCDGLGGVALWRSGGPGICASHGGAQSKNGVLVLDAPAELDAEIHLRNAEAALVASGERELPLMRDAPLVCVFGGLYLMMRNGCVSVASAGASQQMNGGTELVGFSGTALRARREAGLLAVAATSLPTSNTTGLVAFDGASLHSSDGLVGADGAFLWRNGEPELGASDEASLQKNNEVGVVWPGDFDKCPLNIDLVGRGEPMAAVTAGVAMERNGTDVGGDDYEPVVAPDAA